MKHYRVLMKNSIVHRKLIVLTLATVLLVFVLQGISFGQLSAGEIKDDSTNYVVWIVHEEGNASGVLIDKDYRLVVTNAHVVKDNKEVNVFFAVRDSSGKIVRARPFYTNEDHQNTLQRLGYITRGRVIAKYPENEPDLAMIELDGLPGTANPREVLSIDYSKMKEDERVHILGHPGGRPLWHWKAGFFQRKQDSDLLISADAYFGNSGGPVLNMEKKLIGISRAINADRAITLAVPTSAILDLLNTFERVGIFSIYNNTELPIKYKIKWNEDENWKEEEPIEPKKEQLHSQLSKNISTEYPKIRFEDSQNGKESSESIQKLETKYRFFGIGIVEDFESHIESNDALRYQFKSDPDTKKISLVKLKRFKTFVISNNTQTTLYFHLRWHTDENWIEDQDIEPGYELRYGQPSERVSPGYPRIRFDKIGGAEEYPEENRSLLTLSTQTGYFDEATTIKEELNQMDRNSPLLYQFQNNVGTNGISLEELKRIQRFKIRNPTEVRIYFRYKWHENDIWRLGYIDPNETKDYKEQAELVSVGYPKIKYSENVIPVTNKLRSYVGDNIATQNIYRLETETGHYNKKNDEFTPDPYQVRPRGYHFKYNSKTKKLSLYKDKSTRWSIWWSIVIVVSIVVLAVEAVLIVAILLKRHIFSIANNTESIVNYSVKWAKKYDWKQYTLDPSESRLHYWTGFFKKKPQIQFYQPVEDTDPEAIPTVVQVGDIDAEPAVTVVGIGDTDQEVKPTTVQIVMEGELKTKTRHIRQKAIGKISRKDAHKYHFDYDSETNEINLYDSELRQKIELQPRSRVSKF